jgi:hypothetical protein
MCNCRRFSLIATGIKKGESRGVKLSRNYVGGKFIFSRIKKRRKPKVKMLFIINGENESYMQNL